MRLAVVLALSTLVSPAGRATAQSALSGEPIAISRSSGKIAIDGDLGDEGWRNAKKIEKWYEVNPGDNTEPKVKNVGYLTYDDRFLYAGFEFEDPDPSAIKAPFADRDNIGNGYNDYGGVFVDSRNSGRTATLFVVTPRNIQYDSVFDDASNEDSAPDFFWDSATRINAHGWTLEIRIPFSSLRYRNANPQTWGILLYRNYPRDRHFQFFSAKLPRGGNCLVCRSNTLTGLEHLPGGGHLVAAPYVSASEQAQPHEDVGSPLVSEPVKPHIGLDVEVPRPTPTTRSTSRSIRIFHRSNRTPRRFRPTSALRCSFRRSVHSFWKGQICSRRQSRPYIRERLPTRTGVDA